MEAAKSDTACMALQTSWHESRVEVRARLVPRYLWTTASIDVFLNGEPVLRTAGRASRFGCVHSAFHHGGEIHEAELAWGVFANGAFPFTLRINGEILLVAEVPVDYTAEALLGWIGLCAASGILLCLLIKQALEFE